MKVTINTDNTADLESDDGARFGRIPNYDPRTMQPWASVDALTAYANAYPEQYLVAPPPLDALKAAKNAEINAARLVSNQGTFAHAGKLIACDPLGRSDIDGINGFVALTGSLPPGWPGGWKAADNSLLPIADVPAWTAFYGSMVAAGNAHFAHSQALKAQLAAATTAAEVAAISWGG